MADKVPQYADLEITFNNIKYNVTPSTVDLTDIDDIILSISPGSPSRDPIVLLKYTESPSRFTIDNTNKSVSIVLISDEVGNNIGKYYVNLWIVRDGRYITHLSQSFNVVAAVNHTPE